jgi:hypothetical protein
MRIVLPLQAALSNQVDSGISTDLSDWAIILWLSLSTIKSSSSSIGVSLSLPMA